MSNSPLLICISEFLLEWNCPVLLKHCKQTHFCYSVLWSRLPLALYCCCLSFSNSIKVWGQRRSVRIDRPICVLWRRQKLWLQNHLYSSVDYWTMQQDELDLIWDLAHSHISVSSFGFQGCCGRQNCTWFHQILLVKPELVYTSLRDLDQQKELLWDKLVCHVAEKFLTWCCEPYRELFCITELWSEYRNVRFRISWLLSSACK